MVIPDGNYAGEHHGDSEWANSYDHRDLFEDYVAKDVVRWVDANLRSIPDAAHRIIGGVSEGGYGAVNIALRNPNVFGSAISFSGYFRNDGSGWARPVMGSDPKFLLANSPLDYIDSGLGTGRDRSAWRGIRFYLGAGADEKRYAEETKAMAGRLKDAGLPVVLQVSKGKHGWGLWDQLFDTLVPSALAPVNDPITRTGPADAESAGARPADGSSVH
jgi:S-formylglutathione hydrolase FrmB